MAEVKRGFQSLSSKKLPSFSNNGFTVSPSFASSSSSSKHIYDDVFASLPPPRRPYSSEFSGFADDDFGEIFGCSKSENGVWQSSDSTIPILNLPDSESRSTRGGGIDYSGVFGGFGDDSSALPDGEDLSNQFKKKAKTSAPDSIPRGKAEMTGSTGPHISRQSENDQRPTRGFNQSFDSVKHFEHHIEMVPNEPNGLAQVAHVHATAGSTLPSHEVGPSKKTQTGRAPMMKQDAEVGIGIYLVKHGKHSRNSSEVAVSEQKNEHGGGTQKASCLSEVNSAATFHESCPATVVAAPSKLLQEGATVQSDIRDDARIAVSVPRYSSTQEVGPSQKILTNRAPMTKDNDELGVNLSLVKEMAESSRNAGSEFKKGELSKSTSSEFGAQEWKSEKDTDNHETSGLSESNSDQENIGESSKVVKDDTKLEDVACDAMDTEPSDLVANKNNGENAATFHKASSLSGSNQKSGSSEVFEEDVKSSPVSDVRKKPSRHARMTSLDLGDHTHAHQADAATLRKTRFGGSYSFDASHDPSPARIKVQPSKVVPSSSLPQFFPVENHCKISENTDYKGSENNMYRGDGDSLPSLDEQLDVNSMAAISAAALQRALQEAELRIRLAKEFLEREGQGNGKLSFKDTLKLKAGKENNNANAMNEYRHNKLRHRQQLDSRVKTFSHIKRKSVLETAQVLPLREVQRKVPKDEEPMELRNPDVPKSVEGDDKREGGGEWEAAKHLNQLISGVKNRIASFMAWQAETEKKDEPKETETSKKTQQQSQSKQELNDAEFFEMEATEKNDYASVFAYESMPGECKTSLIPESIELNGFMQNNTAMEQDIGHEVDVPDNARKSWSQSKTGFISGVIKPDGTELVESNIAAEQKAGDKYNVVCDNEGSTRTSFLFFTFSNEKSWVPNNSGGENRETEGRRELGVKNPLKEKKNEVEVDDDQMQCKNEDANQEELDHICVSQDCEKIFEGSSNGESNGTVEEPKSVHGYDGSKHAFEEDGDRRLNQKSGDDRSEFTHEDNCDSRLNEEYEYEDDRSVFTYQENRKQSEEFRGDINKFTCQKNDTLNDEYEDNRSEFDHEEDRRMNENCRDDRGESSYQEDKRLSEECADNCSDFIHNEGIMPSDEHEGNLSNFSHEENNDNRQSENFGSDQSNFTHGEIGDIKVNEDCDEEPMNTSDCCETFAMTIVTDYEREEYKEIEDAEDQLDDREQLEEANLVHDLERSTEVIEELDEKQENEKDQGLDKNAEELSQQMNGWEENNIQANRTVEKKDEVPDKVDFNLADDLCNERENGFLSETEDAYGMNSGIGETGNPNEESEKMMEMKSPSEPEMDREVTELPDEETEKMMETSDSSSEPQEDANHRAFAQEASESTGEERVIKTSSSDHKMEFHENVHVDGTDGTLPHENFLLHKSEAYANFGPKDEDGNAVESKSDESWENPTEYSNESAETVDVREAPNISEHVGEKCSFEAIPKRRRWFENGETVGNVDRPSILEVDRTNSEIDPEVVEESDFAGSVEIHADKQENEASEVTAAEGSDSALNQENNRANVEATHKRRRWFVNRGGEGIVEPPSLFGGAKVGSEMESEIVDESEGFVDHMHTESRDTWNMGEADVVVNEEKRKHSVEVTPRRKRWFESVDKVGPNQQQRRDEDARTSVHVNQEHKEGDKEKSREENYDVRNDTEPVGEVHRDLDAANRRKKEKEKERLAVGRAIREARERAFAEARERARRDAAVERPKMEGIQRVGSQDRPGKASAEATSASDKASMEAKLRSERAAVERATAEARERALQKALSEKGSHRLRDPTGRHQPERSSSFDPRYHTSSSSARSLDTSNKGEKLDGTDVESAQRRKARLERQTRTMERAAKALEEKNKRDLQAQKEQAARNMMADALDVEVRRWSSGKEGNLRALLSTLQYILGSDSGWQAISLTELVAPTAVRKAYKKATLCVHPDKLQQRGATIQQKYVCEKVFDLLKEAWSKFNPDER